MLDHGRGSVVGINVDAVDYEAAVERVIEAATRGTPMAVSALAVHGVMTGVLDPVHRHRLNSFELIVPDGQPVRWALNLLHSANLKDRVYGPSLMMRVCERAALEDVSIYLYGSTQIVLERLQANLTSRFPTLTIAGAEPSKFRKLTADEKSTVVRRIRGSGAGITFVGLGCPRQEVWAYEYRDFLSMPVIAVGAAFDFHAGTLPQAPASMQRLGFEWLYRLVQEPRRLWRRYLYLNPAYVTLLALQFLGLRRFDSDSESIVPTEELSYG